MKRKTGRFEVLSFEGGFHGRTAHAAAMGGMAGPKKNYGPTVPGIIRAPYPNPYRDTLGFCDDGPDFKKYFEYLDYLVMANSSGSLAGAIVEPYQGAAGFIFPPEGWLTKLQEWLRSRDMLFTLDEVQSSYGRTGKMWAMLHEDLEPDIVTLGKGIGSGIATSAIAARADVFACLSKGEMSSTLGGNPVASAGVSAVLDIFAEEDLVGNSAKIGARLMAGLKEIQKDCPYLGDVRGMGMVIGIEFVKDKATKEPAPELIHGVIETMANHGVLVGSVGMYGNVIRVAPPLVMTEAEADESLEAAAKALATIKL